MRKTLLALAAVLALALGACGAEGGDDASDDETTTTTEAEAPEETTTTEAEDEPEETTTTEDEGSGSGSDVEEWAAGFCSEFGAWQSDIQTAAGDVQNNVEPGNMESAKSAIVGMLETASTETQELVTALEDGGSPDIEDGDALVEDLIGKFEEFDGAIVAVRDDVEALSTADPTAFQSEVTTLMETFQTEVTEIGESFQELDEDYPSEELNDALNSSCDL